MYELTRYKITSRSTTQLMPGKKTKQLLFVMMPKLEDVMNVTKRDCSRPPQRFRHLMTAQPDPRDHSNPTQGTVRMTTT